MTTPHVLAARPALQQLVTRLHQRSLEQEEALKARGTHYPKGVKESMSDQLVALDEDKARDMYLILRAMGARRVVEAGTSHGVSLLWLLAAVLDNDAASPPNPSALPSLVVGTENEPHKAAIALDHVGQGFDSHPRPLNLLQGDILETLPALGLAPRSVDALLLDIWSPLALPTLKIVLPSLRIGAAVFIDNTVASKERYKELLEFLRAPSSGFASSTLPHSGGFELCVYTGNRGEQCL